MASAFSEGFRMGSDIYDSSERMKLMKEQQDWAREEAAAKRGERQREADIRTAGQETYGRVGQPAGGQMGPQPESALPQSPAAYNYDYLKKAADPDRFGRYMISVEDAQAKLAGYDAQSGLPKGNAAQMFPKQEMYTEDQAEKDYLQKLRGIDIKKAQEHEKSGLELSSLKRGERYAQQQENALGFNQHVLKDAAAGLSPEELIKKHIMPVYNENKLAGVNDGKTMKIIPSALEGGEATVVLEGKDGKQETLGPVSYKMVHMLTAEGQSIMMASSTPENYWKHKEQFVKELQASATVRQAAAHETTADVAKRKLEADLKAGLPAAEAAKAWAMVNHYNADADYRRASAKSLGEKTGNWAMVGTDSDGQPISYDKNTGTFARPDAKPIQNVDVFKRLSGEKAPKEPISNKDVLDFIDKFGDSPSNEKDRKTGKAIPIRQLPPTQQKAYAEDFFQKGAGTNGAGGLPTNVKPEARQTEAPATAPTKAALPAMANPIGASGLPTEAPAPIKSIAYGKTVYKMPGMLGGFDTPQQAQAAWAQKNAPRAPLSFND